MYNLILGIIIGFMINTVLSIGFIIYLLKSGR
jgi:hypothetical protein